MIDKIWKILRAFINTPDALHWITKYEAAKKDNEELRAELIEKKIEIFQLEEEKRDIIRARN